MSVVLDTSVLIDALRGREEVRRALNAFSSGVGMYSAITFSELLAGVHDAENEKALTMFLGPFRFCEVTEPVARQAGALRRLYGAGGLALTDALIAATALVHGAVLVTRDRIFSRIPGLRVEPWYRCS